MWLGVGAVFALTLALAPLKGWLRQSAPPCTGLRVLDVELAYQAVTLALATALLRAVRWLGGPLRFLARGELGAPAARLWILGVEAGEPWRSIVRNFAILAGLITAAVVVLQNANGVPGWSSHLLVALALALPFAAVNAAVEEGIVRIALLEVTIDALGAARAAWLSGALFGAVHYFGVPGGLPGVAMAGFLGFVLARSVIETRGALGAWLVHFVQDVVIFTVLFSTALAEVTS